MSDFKRLSLSRKQRKMVIPPPLAVTPREQRLPEKIDY